MKTIRIRYTILALLLISMIYACKKVDLSKISSDAWNPSLAVPLAKGEFSVYDVLEKDTGDLIVIDQQGALALIYTSEKVLLNAADVASLPDQNFNFSESANGIGAPIVPSYSGTQTFNYSEIISLTNPLGAELYDVDFKNGLITISTSTTLLHDVKYTFSFPDLTENGTPVSRVINLVYGGTVPQIGSTTINLNTVFVDLTNGPNAHSEINVNVAVEITGSGNPIIGAESVDFSFNVANMEYDLVHGYFGMQNLFNAMDTVDIKLFNNFTSGSFSLINPSIDLTFVNSFGLPVQIGINQIKTKETTSGTEYPLTGFPPTFNVTAPITVGQSSSSTLSLSTSNTGNLNTIITPTPKSLIYDVDGISNPAGQAINFVKDDSKLKLKGTLNLPLEGFATGFMFSDTIEASADFDQEFVESVMIRLNTENGFPVEANVKVLLVDQNYSLLKDLTNGTQTLIGAAPVNSAGKATTKVQKINDFTITKAELPLLSNMKYIIFEVDSQTFQGNQGTMVKMYEDYMFTVRVGMQVQGSVQF